MTKKSPPPFVLSDAEVIRAITDDFNPWNRARQIFRHRSVAIDGVGNPIEQRRQEFYAVLEIVNVILEDDRIIQSAEKSIREAKGSEGAEAAIAAAERKEQERKRRR